VRFWEFGRVGSGILDLRYMGFGPSTSMFIYMFLFVNNVDAKIFMKKCRSQVESSNWLLGIRSC
jgi:hypothetical protein